ncbi:MAG: 3-dehydroquinate synthase [Tannerella sp.]|jgi:3-dehydroquinate synthase|nr:3-dehydroquinate synthase [Tannerella sp.]
MNEHVSPVMDGEVVFSSDIAAELASYLSRNSYDRIYVLTDTHTHGMCLPLLDRVSALTGATHIVIEAGDAHKSIEQVMRIWQTLSQTGASRASLLINLGGGMVSDLGGFAAASFKRGIHTLNIPTTLMAAVDAAVGGKTGINFNGLKNEVGAFHMPDCVMIDCRFLHTLDRDNLLSGYAEMLKHGLISSARLWADTLNYDPAAKNPDPQALAHLVKESVAVKSRIVAEDPYEKGLRKALNLGHTAGHAFESLSFAQQRPLLHGHAVAAGLVAELYLSHKCCGFPSQAMRQTIYFIKTHYPPFVFDCHDYDTLCERMTHDKKNENGLIRFTLLSDIGQVRINQEAGRKQILESFDFYREAIF